MPITLLTTLFLALQAQEPSTATLYETAERARLEDRPEEALAGFRAVLAKQPDHVPAHLGYQKLLQHQKKEPELVAEYEALHKKAGAPWTCFLYGRLLHDAAKEEELYRKGLQLEPANPWLREELVWALRRQRRFDEAIRAQLEVLKDSKDSMQAHVTYIRVMEEAGRQAELLKIYPAPIDAAGETAHSMAFHGIALVLCGRGTEGVPFLEKAVKLAPKNPRVLEALAVGLGKARQFDRAIESLAGAIRLDPHDAKILKFHGMMLAAVKRSQDGFAHLREAVRLEPGDGDGFSSLGMAHGVHDDYESAENCYREAIRLDGLDDVALHRMGLLQFNRKDYAGCVEWSQRAIRINDQEASYHHLLGDAYRRLGKPDLARESFERASRLKSSFDVTVGSGGADDGALILDPKEMEAQRLISLAKLLLQEGKTAEAQAKYGEALKADPSNTTAPYALARIHQRLGEWGPALARYERLRVDERRPALAARITMRTADCLYELGRFKEAAELYRSTHEAFGDRLSSFERPGEIVEALNAATPASERFRIPGLRIGECAKENYCAPKSLDCVLRFWKRPSDLLVLGKALVAERGPTTAEIFAHIAGRTDVSCVAFLGDSEVLKGLVKQGLPILLMRSVAGRESMAGHISVVVGYDAGRRVFILEDSLWFEGAHYAPYSAIPGLWMMLVAPPEAVQRVEAALPGRDYCGHVVDAQRCWAKKDLEGVERALHLALKQRPESAESHTLMGILALERQDTKAAVDWLRKGALLPYADALTHVLLARALSETQNLDEAAKSLEAALRLEPDYSEALIHLGTNRLFRKDAAGAVTPLKRLVDLDDSNAQGRLLLGVALAILEKPDEAIRHLSFAARHPECFAAYRYLAKAWLAKRQPARAITALRKYLQAVKDPDERARTEEFLKELQEGPPKK